jgi:integrase
MASIYARGEILWIKFKGKSGKPECRSSGYRLGQEALARELAVEVERQATLERETAAPATPPGVPGPHKVANVLPMPAPTTPAPVASANAPAERIGPDAPAGAMTVAAYVEEWLKLRTGVETMKDEATRLRLHVIPLLGHMAIAEVRPKHIRDLINAIKRKTSTAPKCKDQPLAPRTVRLIYSTLGRMFKSAVVDEHIAASPVVLEGGVLPKNVDKDPEWRSTAIFERDELVKCVSDPRIAMYRRVFYALEGIAGVRHSEAAALRWRDRNTKCAPLGKLTVSRSGDKKRTKTQITREVPIHPSLAAILDAWEASGWSEKYGRRPTPDDLILPTESNKVRKPSNTLKEFHRDLATIGLRIRRGHDLRRTFVTLARADGGRADVLRPLTHPGEKDIIGLYTSFPWAVVCEELAKLRIPLPVTVPPVESAPTNPVPDVAAEAASKAGGQPAHKADSKITRDAPAAVPSYSRGYTPDCSPEISNDNDALPARSAIGQRFRKP